MTAGHAVPPFPASATDYGARRAEGGRVLWVRITRAERTLFVLAALHCGSAGALILVGLGVTAIAFALFLPRGLWGTRRRHLQLLPLGHDVARDAGAADAGKM